MLLVQAAAVASAARAHLPDLKKLVVPCVDEARRERRADGAQRQHLARVAPCSCRHAQVRRRVVRVHRAAALQGDVILRARRVERGAHEAHRAALQHLHRGAGEAGAGDVSELDALEGRGGGTSGHDQAREVGALLHYRGVCTQRFCSLPRGTCARLCAAAPRKVAACAKKGGACKVERRVLHQAAHAALAVALQHAVGEPEARLRGGWWQGAAAGRRPQERAQLGLVGARARHDEEVVEPEAVARGVERVLEEARADLDHALVVGRAERQRGRARRRAGAVTLQSGALGSGGGRGCAYVGGRGLACGPTLAVPFRDS